MPSGRGWFLIWMIVLAALCGLRGSLLTSPPYDDHALGIWNEAQFLAKNNFDYVRLRYVEKNVMEGGGVRSYMISILPTLLALLINAFPNPIVPIFIAHLTVYACASLIVVIIMRCLWERTGGIIALLTGLAVVTTPTFLVQTQMIGMEIIMTAAGMTGFLLLINGSPKWASLFFLLSFFVKASGALYTLAAIPFLILHLLGTRTANATMSKRTAFSGLIANVVSLGVQSVAGIWADDPVILLQDFYWPAILKVPRIAIWAPEIAVLWCLSLALTILALIVWLLQQRRTQPENSGLVAACQTTLGRLVDEEAIAVFSFIFFSGITVALSMYMVLQRYATPAFPFMYILISLSLIYLSIPRFLLTTLLAYIVAVNIFNHDGKLYPRSDKIAAEEYAYWTWWHPRMGCLTERSEEYLVEHREVMKAMRVLERDYSEHPIFTEALYSYYLGEPIYGYVQKPLPNIIRLESFPNAINAFTDAMLPIVQGKSDNFPVFIWSGKSRTLIPPPGPYAEILFDDHHPILPLVLYRLKPEMLPKDKVSLEEWWLDHTWGPDWQAMRLLERFSYLRESGRTKRILELFDQAKTSLPADDRIGLGRSLDEMRKSISPSP